MGGTQKGEGVLSEKGGMESNPEGNYVLGLIRASIVFTVLLHELFSTVNEIDLASYADDTFLVLI